MKKQQGDCILSDLREKKFKKTAEFFRQRRIQREEYIQEYKKLRRRKVHLLF